MAEPTSIIRGRRVLLPEGIAPAALHLRDGKILTVAAYEAVPPGVPVHEAGDRLVTPGVVDSHVHLNEPGRSEYRHKLTPYAGKRLRGVVHQTWVGGSLAYDASAGLARPHGRFLSK